MSENRDNNNINLKDVLAKLLNPRSRLDGVASFSRSLDNGEVPAMSGGRIRARDIFGNLPLMLGIIIVLSLFILVLYGPAIAPQNPYIAGQHIVPHFDREKNEFIRPPLEPSPEYPLGTDQWGADILSLLLHGARNTLIACAFITMVRVLLGLVLGAVAGWNEGATIDRTIMGIIGAIASLPLLISTIILLYALDIRRGLLVFIVALSVMGWTEIAQFIRSEFMVLRKMPYIEGAKATGLNGLQIAVRHVLPNVLPQLLVISFLEMGAVLMLLGELAFAGVFIGGGSRIDLTEPLGPTRIFTLAEVPEWGAMLADGFRWLRSKPFIVFPPAMAFFVAVVGFNSLGEGLRRLIEKQSLNTAFLLRKRMLGVVAVLTLATVFIMNNTGAAPWFAKVAQAYDSSRVYDHVAALAVMDGRSVAQPGGVEAANYIAAKFEEFGLEPGAKGSTYFHTIKTSLVQPTAQPALVLLDGAGETIAEFRHQLDFGFMIEGHGGSGEVTAPLTFVGFSRQKVDWQEFSGLDLRGRIVLLDQDNAPASFATEAMIRGALGVIWMSGDGRDDIRSQIQLAYPDQDYLRLPQLPIFRVRPYVAASFLAVDDLTPENVMDAEPTQSGPGWFTHDLTAVVRMSVALSEPVVTQVPSVMGYIPGSDLDIADELVVLYTTYDGLGTDPDGTVYPAASQGSSGVGLLLELARLWQEQGLDTRRTTLFVAWGGAQLDESGVKEWLEDDFSFRHMRTQAVNSRVIPTILMQLDQVGLGDDVLLIHPQSNKDLAELIIETSQETGLAVSAAADTKEFANSRISNRAPVWIALKWAGPNLLPTEDTAAAIDREKLQDLGQVLALMLTNVARETDY